MEGPEIRSIQWSAAKRNDDTFFMSYGSSMITKRITDSFIIIKKDLVNRACLEFSTAIDTTKVTSEISIDTRIKALVGGAFSDYFI